MGLAINESGWVYVRDQGAQRIRVFTPGGVFAFQFAVGSGSAIGINTTTGHVYVGTSNTIQIYTATGQWVSGWGSYGNGDGQFDGIFSIAVNVSGYVYVADAYNYRIQVFSPLGSYLTQWGSYGESREDQFEAVYGVAVNASGYIYVSDGSNNSIKVFTTSGQFVKRWGEYGSGSGYLNSNDGVAINGSGYICVTDSGNHRVQVFDQAGQFVRAWGSEGSAPGQFLQMHGITTNSSGHVFVGDSDKARVQVFDQNGPLLGNLGKSATDPGCLKDAEGVAVNSTGAIYVADYSNDRVQVFDPDGSYLFNWYVLRPRALAINSSDSVYVSGNTVGAPVAVFTPKGSLLYSFGYGLLSIPVYDIAINSSGCVFVTGIACIRVFGPDGAHLYDFGEPGAEVYQLANAVMGVAIGPDKLVHVANWYRGKVFTVTGTYVRCYARDISNSNGGFSDTLGRVRVDSAGVAYLVDTGAGRVSAFAPYGSLSGEWSTGAEQFATPKGIIVNASGHVFVADASQIQLFSTLRIPRPERPVLTRAMYDPMSKEVSLQWGAVAGATSYRVYRYSNSTGRTLVGDFTHTSAQDMRLPPDVYRYEVAAWNGYEESEASAAKTVKVEVEIFQDWTPAIIGSASASVGGAIVVGVFLHWRKKRYPVIE